jgi:hypothetical protein
LCSPVVAIDLVGSSRKLLFRERVCGTTTPAREAWLGGILACLSQKFTRNFSIGKKRSATQKTCKNAGFLAPQIKI